MESISFSLKTTSDSNSTWGHDSVSYTEVMVDADGTVRSLDAVSGTYTLHHSLTTEQVAEAQRLAGLVRDGSAYVAASHVIMKK